MIITIKFLELLNELNLIEKMKTDLSRDRPLEIAQQPKPHHKNNAVQRWLIASLSKRGRSKYVS